MINRDNSAVAAFTLIELLVVVGIIAILSGLLLPALTRGTVAARSTECRQNLHDLGLAFRLYADEFDHYPPGGGMGILAQSPEFGWLMLDDWKEILAPYVGVKEDVNIPALRKLRCPQTLLSGTIRGNGQYAYNASGTAKASAGLNLGLGGSVDRQSGKFRATPESAVRAPADLVAAGDVDVRPNQNVFWTAGAFDVVSTQQWLWPGKSHSGRANLLLCDGHVESQRQTNWVSGADSARSRWNVDYQPHPESWTAR